MTSLHDRLMEGCICHPKRWSGDTHDDLGGSIREAATDDLMKEAAEELRRLELLLAELASFESLARWVANSAGHGISAGQRNAGSRLLDLIQRVKKDGH